MYIAGLKQFDNCMWIHVNISKRPTRQIVNNRIKAGTKSYKNNIDLSESKFPQLPLNTSIDSDSGLWGGVPCGECLDEESCLVVQLRSGDLMKLERVVSLVHWVLG